MGEREFLQGLGGMDPIEAGVDTFNVPANAKAHEIKNIEWLNKMTPIAKRVSEQTGVPASLILAQAAEETGWGKKQSGHNNVMGTTGEGKYKGSTKSVQTHEYENGVKVPKTRKFRNYGSVEQSMTDYANNLKTHNAYGELRENWGDPIGMARSLGNYASNPKYAQNIENIINSNDLTKADSLRALQTNPSTPTNGSPFLEGLVGGGTGQSAPGPTPTYEEMVTAKENMPTGFMRKMGTGWDIVKATVGELKEQIVAGGTAFHTDNVDGVTNFRDLWKRTSFGTAWRSYWNEVTNVLGFDTSHADKALARDLEFLSAEGDPMVEEMRAYLSDAFTVHGKTEEEFRRATMGKIDIAMAPIFFMGPAGVPAKVAMRAMKGRGVNLVASKMAAAEIHGVSTMLAYEGAGKWLAGKKPNWALAAGLGIVAPPLGMAAGKGMGMVGKGVGAAVRPGVKSAERLGAYIAATKYGKFADQLFDNTLRSGEGLLRRHHMNRTADGSRLARIEMRLLGGAWSLVEYRATRGMKAMDRTLMFEVLEAPLNQQGAENLARAIAAKGSNPERILKGAAAIREQNMGISRMAEEAGVLVQHTDGTLRRYRHREDFGNPHRWSNTEELIEGGKLNAQSLAAVKARHPQMSDKDAQAILTEIHEKTLKAMDTGDYSGMGYINLQGRRYDLPGYITDPSKIYPEYYGTMSRKIVNTRMWGPQAEAEHFYRGTTQGSTQRIDEPFKAAIGKTFMARKKGTAKMYGSSVERIEAKSGARILHEEDDAFWELIGHKKPPNESIISTGRSATEAVDDAIKKAEAAGYDAVSFSRDSDIGTVILNESMFIRNAKTPKRAAGKNFTRESEAGDMYGGGELDPNTGELVDAFLVPNQGVRQAYPRAYDEILAMPEETARMKKAKSHALAVMDRQLGAIEPGDDLAKGMANLAQYQAIVKLGLSQFTQLTQFFAALGPSGYRGAFRDLVDTFSRTGKGHEFTLRSGAIMDGLIRESQSAMIGGATAGRGAERAFDVLRKIGFTYLDRKARIFGALRGKAMATHQAEELGIYLDRLGVAKGAEKRLVDKQIRKISEKFRKLDIDPDEVIRNGGRLSDDDLLKAGLRLSTDVNFWGDSMSLPVFWKSPYGKIAMQFKSFAYQQGIFMKNAVVTPAIYNNEWGPAVRLLVGMGISGEMIEFLKSTSKGNQKDRDFAERLLHDLTVGGGFGIAFDAIRATNYKNGIMAAALGPTAGTITELAELPMGIHKEGWRAPAKMAAAYGIPLFAIPLPSVLGGVMPALGQRVKQHLKGTNDKPERRY